jgi:hypothetical protein
MKLLYDWPPHARAGLVFAFDDDRTSSTVDDEILAFVANWNGVLNIAAVDFFEYSLANPFELKAVDGI